MSKVIELEEMFVVIDSDDFPVFQTVATTYLDAKSRMEKLGGKLDWEYFTKNGYRIEKVDIKLTVKDPGER